eukprot:scaffold631_cov378-Prasinococcus_capsulatus_cf.AAC.6
MPLSIASKQSDASLCTSNLLEKELPRGHERVAVLYLHRGQGQRRGSQQEKEGDERVAQRAGRAVPLASQVDGEEQQRGHVVDDLGGSRAQRVADAVHDDQTKEQE